MEALPTRGHLVNFTQRVDHLFAQITPTLQAAGTSPEVIHALAIAMIRNLDDAEANYRYASRELENAQARRDDARLMIDAAAGLGLTEWQCLTRDPHDAHVWRFPDSATLAKCNGWPPHPGVTPLERCLADVPHEPHNWSYSPGRQTPGTVLERHCQGVRIAYCRLHVTGLIGEPHAWSEGRDNLWCEGPTVRLANPDRTQVIPAIDPA